MVEGQVSLAPQNNSFEDSAASAQDDRTILPNGMKPLAMPQGSQFYTPWCKQMLKIARSGKLGKRKERDEDHEDDKENGEQEDSNETAKLGFTAKRWHPLPRSAEEPEREYLAPRRPGLPKVGANVSHAVGPNGETVVNGAAVDEPVRRRMPPPRRKPKKGPGRRKKMTEGDGVGVSASAEVLEGAQSGGGQANGEAQAGAEAGGDENEGDEEEGEEGDEGADDDREEGELSDDKEEDSKQLHSTFQGNDAKKDVRMPDAEDQAAKKQSEPLNGLPPRPQESVLPGLGLGTATNDKEEGEIDAEDDEEDYEPPPPPSAPIAAPAPVPEDDEDDYSPPEPSAPVPGPSG